MDADKKRREVDYHTTTDFADGEKCFLGSVLITLMNNMISVTMDLMHMLCR